jgi:hypothetical protein
MLNIVLVEVLVLCLVAGAAGGAYWGKALSERCRGSDGNAPDVVPVGVADHFTSAVRECLPRELNGPASEGRQ